ncbi:DNA polymerase III subunit delta' [Streptomyces phaeochromogenes]|uniref:DNA polymerase III subunit delta n=1 Tax=Streptomyces phaeochromogenes TaxID=1923 RepID=A0ABZ1HED3_STRPH|nr:DNA polymerase III subunit delta' [Streptomyces phaeochromogenes]MCX5605333.1 DNA polymerase III subunit delta' [Streptomyces phaeochromogenes]WRZ31383.1 DNA polymerase III subunit delta' [Streptomyces phaeochromogenes]WSD16948.1 DNA polymerase III subunit delta' [Streptomyces phaeochromogenes]WSJ06252.1 DNA polymerase III subunit delta' [Streptomyces phaeochromogenes]WSS95418.1 DNA polymerase III subunit delta' [Streptomyces phaeochromogenes]
MTVWDDLVGQEKVSAQLDAAARDADAQVTAVVDHTPVAEASKMTHAWLFTGPPGSGRSTAARAFAAALQCVSPDRALGGSPGCGFCDGCHTSLIGTHADVQIIRTDLLSIGVKETRDLVRRAQMSPAGRRWQVIIVEDADRLTEGAGNVLLKAIEEPAPRTVWLLCAPSIEDVLPTIRSRCRHLTLRTPPVDAVADVLVRRDGIEPDVAAAVARATQGHIGRARRLATDKRARERRAAVLKLPLRVDDVGACLKAAQELIDAASEDAKQVAEETDVKETEDMKAALGASQGGRMPRGTAGVMKELEDKQKRRKTRTQRDSLDLALIDLTAFYRDVLALQFGTSLALANTELRDTLDRLARGSSPETTLRRIEAIAACREALDRNVAPLLAVEAMTMALRAG